MNNPGQWRQPFYAVGLNNDWTEDLDPARLEYAFAKFFRTHQAWLKNPRCCLGVWEGSIQGQSIVVLDISVLVHHEEVARRFGREGNQFAIFSLENGRETATEGTGESNEARLRRLEKEDRVTLPLGTDDE